MWAVIDRDGCGGIAFYLTEKPWPGKILLASECLMLDKTTHPDVGSQVVCCSCGRRLNSPSIDWIEDETEVTV